MFLRHGADFSQAFVDEKLDQHMAGLAPSAGFAGRSYLFYGGQLPRLDALADSALGNLQTVTDYFVFLRGWDHQS